MSTYETPSSYSSSAYCSSSYGASLWQGETDKATTKAASASIEDATSKENKTAATAAATVVEKTGLQETTSKDAASQEASKASRKEKENLTVAEKAQQKKKLEQDTALIKELAKIHFDSEFEGSELIQVERDVYCLQNLSTTQERIVFDDYCEKSGIILENITVEDDKFKNGVREATANFFIPDELKQLDEHPPDFRISFNRSTKVSWVNCTYRGCLPNWIKFGDKKLWLDKDRGIPTAKVICRLMMAKLGMNKDNVETFEVCSMNAQTSVDLIHACVIEKKSIKEALALTHTAMLTAELGQMLGHAQLYLKRVDADYDGDTADLGSRLSVLTKDANAKFRKSKKIEDLAKAGIHLIRREGMKDEDVIGIPESLDFVISIKGSVKPKHGN